MNVAYGASGFSVQRGIGEFDEAGHDTEELHDGDDVLVTTQGVLLAQELGCRVANELE